MAGTQFRHYLIPFIFTGLQVHAIALVKDCETVMMFAALVALLVINGTDFSLQIQPALQTMGETCMHPSLWRLMCLEHFANCSPYDLIPYTNSCKPFPQTSYKYTIARSQLHIRLKMKLLAVLRMGCYVIACFKYMKSCND